MEFSEAIEMVGKGIDSVGVAVLVIGAHSLPFALCETDVPRVPTPTVNFGSSSVDPFC